MPDISTSRSEFPGLADKIYLDTASFGIPPRAAVVAAQRVIARLERGPSLSGAGHQESLDRELLGARAEAARLLSADPGEIALVSSTSQGLSAVLGSIPFETGDNIVVAEMDFPQILAACRELVHRRGVDMRTVSHSDGRLALAAFGPAIDHRTRAVVVSSVQWISGFRIDIGALAAAAHRRGAFLVVDAMHHLGAARLDTGRHRADAVACGGHTWLGSPFGMGLLFVSREAQERLVSPWLGRAALGLPRGGWEALIAPDAGEGDRAVADDARRFEGGGAANYVGAAALSASLSLLNSVGPEAIEAHILETGGRLIEELRGRGYRVQTPREPERRAGIITFQAKDDPDRERELARRLLRDRIHVSVRRSGELGGMRVSVALHTTEGDCASFLGALERLAPPGSH
jgi:selenocysteine lyase/cysteine desulfurase